MRVFVRGLILAALLCASAPSVASAAPILGLGSTDCGTILLAETTTCSSLTIDPYAAGAIEGEFVFVNDVALFSFTLTGDTLFSASTTSFATSGFDSTFGIFEADGTRSLVSFPDGSQYARSEDINPDPDNANYDDQLAPFLLEAGTYVLALVMYPNDFRSGEAFGLADSLLAGFQSDADAQVICAPSCAFSLTIDATLVDGEPQRVPEPTTLVLVASGALAAFVRRRPRKRV